MILYGVTGAGKTLVGRLLAQDLGWTFYDADDFHPPFNVEKMRRGIPLTDADRWPWLETVRACIASALEARQNAVLACSALKRAYREHLRIDDRVKLVHLRGDYPLIAARLRDRREHFMNPNLLQSQFDALEDSEGEAALVLDVGQTPSELVHAIRTRLGV